VADKKKIRFSSASYRVHPHAIKNLEIKIKPHKTRSSFLWIATFVGGWHTDLGRKKGLWLIRKKSVFHPHLTAFIRVPSKILK
jgi:hypothetical protein